VGGGVDTADPTPVAETAAPIIRAAIPAQQPSQVPATDSDPRSAQHVQVLGEHLHAHPFPGIEPVTGEGNVPIQI
jgi:hypothetical protein